jgi:monoterpene epsilon-lactone hydrolase
MESLQSRVFKLIFRILRYVTVQPGKPLNLDKFHRFESPLPPKNLVRKYNIVTWSVEGQPAYTLHYGKVETGRHLLYLHGGSYTMGIIKPHWLMVGNLVRRLKTDVTLFDYPLAPHHTPEAICNSALTCYSELLRRTSGKLITIIGDSAGGGLSLALGQKIREKGLRQPEHIILISPWLDVTMSNPNMDVLEKQDVLLNRSQLKQVGEIYAGNDDPSDPLISPINTNLKGFPPMILFIGTHDLFLADCRKFRDLAIASRVNLKYFEYKGMIHDWILLPIPEARKAFGELEVIFSESKN